MNYEELSLESLEKIENEIRHIIEIKKKSKEYILNLLDNLIEGIKNCEEITELKFKVDNGVMDIPTKYGYNIVFDGNRTIDLRISIRTKEND